MVDFAPQTGVRQTRLLEGEYVVTKDDVMSRRHFADTVCRGRDYYTPYRAMLPREVDQLLVAGRHYSATPQAQKSSREIPPCMAMGEAAGVAATVALNAGTTVRKADIAAIQHQMRAQGADPGDVPSHQRNRPGGRRMTPFPLEGIRVIDFTQVMLGPCCTQVLADYGAEVIKIEKEKIGDLSRWSLGSDPDGLNNPGLHLAQSQQEERGAQPQERGRPRPGAGADRRRRRRRQQFPPRRDGAHGLRLRRRCASAIQRLIYAVGTGFGLEGPNRHKGGQDVLAQAMSGVMARKADPAHPMAIYATTLCDYSAGMHLVQGILLALLQREKTGRGQQVAVSLYNSMLAMQMQEAAARMMRGNGPELGRLSADRRLRDDRPPVVMVGAFKQNPLRDICKALEIEDLSQERALCGFRCADGPPRRNCRQIFREQIREEEPRALARTSRRRRHPVCAGPHPGRGAARTSRPSSTA